MNLKLKKKAFNEANCQAFSLANTICQEEHDISDRNLRGLSLVAYVAVLEILASQLMAIGLKKRTAGAALSPKP